MVNGLEAFHLAEMLRRPQSRASRAQDTLRLCMAIRMSWDQVPNGNGNTVSLLLWPPPNELCQSVLQDGFIVLVH